MKRPTAKSIFLCSAAALLAVPAIAHDFDIPAGDLKSALDAYVKQAGVELVVSSSAIKGVKTRGVKGDVAPDEALTRILKGTGFSIYRQSSGALGITQQESSVEVEPVQLAQLAPRNTSVETVTVTSSKLGGVDVQSVPIAITAMSQEQLTATQTAGGPDLVKNVPNLTFTKTNFTGYSIQIRGIGTQAISVATDPAVAVAFNDTPFIRNHFFEQEFFDVAQVEVLRGPQGTLYGRNATAGVVNVASAKPTDQWEAMASVDVGNYNNRRLEGMLNVPIFEDKLAVRLAGEWTKRDGYSFNDTTKKSIDGRDLWSSRLTVGFKPMERLQAYLVWEHFDEKDDRVRSAKQLCKKDNGPESVDGLDITNLPAVDGSVINQSAYWRAFLSQGCKPTSFYSNDAFQTPNGQAIPFVFSNEFIFSGFGGGAPGGYLLNQVDPYASKTQSHNLRVIESDLSPTYRAKNDVIEFNADFNVTPELTLASQTAYSKDSLQSTQDFNRFNTEPGIFGLDPGGALNPSISPDGIFCDPQLGCSTKMVGSDLSQEGAWQFNQEIRLSSNFSGPLNFSIGANYMHYQTLEDYYIFFNLLTASTMLANHTFAGDYAHCYQPFSDNQFVVPPTPVYSDRGPEYGMISNQGCNSDGPFGTYIDPNPVSQLDGQGHNYFRSKNPYHLNSWAGFGEVYYQVAPDVKLTGGLRWTDDKKRFWNIPSWVYLEGGGYPVQSIVDQEWKEITGRFNVNWTPKLDFTDDTLVYASFAHGYKGGGANPPGPQGATVAVVHPATFAPEYINAFELGTKNTLLDGGLTLNGDVFYYDYKGYQISQIVDRTSINLNVDAKVKGAEVEATWEPLPGLRFNLTGGLEDSRINDGQSAIDLMDRTAGHTDWIVVKPFVAETSNCIVPASFIRQYITQRVLIDGTGEALPDMIICDLAYNPAIFGGRESADSIFEARAGTTFDVTSAPNGGAGFSKDLGGNKLPNTPPFTLSIGGQYSMPLSESWAGTLRGDFYWQGNSFARIFNDKPYDQLHGYTNLNFALIFTNQDGWQAMAYVKNVLDTTAITGAFLNSDDTALTTNVFLTDPRLFGLRVTKNW